MNIRKRVPIQLLSEVFVIRDNWINLKAIAEDLQREVDNPQIVIPKELEPQIDRMSSQYRASRSEKRDVVKLPQLTRKKMLRGGTVMYLLDPTLFSAWG